MEIPSWPWEKAARPTTGPRSTKQKPIQGRKLDPEAPIPCPNFKNKGKATFQSDSIEMDMCYHYGSKDHWSRVCQANLEAIAKYHSRRESNFAHVELPEDATTFMDVSDF
ncbi:hypothetical protein ACFXTO_019107 [Malus domestica]